MTERFKVLGAMLALLEFTAAELADFSGVNLNTVRVVIGREKEFWEEVGQSQSGQRGGQFLRYRLRPERVAALEEAIQKLQQEARSLARKEGAMGNFKSKAPEEVPVSLLAAEDALARRFTEAATLEDRVHLLKLSEMSAAKYDQHAANPALACHLEALHTLQEICLVEIAQESESAIGPIAFAVLRDKVLKSADMLMSQGAVREAALLLRRAVAGPIAESDSALQWKLQVLAESVTHQSQYARLVAVKALGTIAEGMRSSKIAPTIYEDRILREALKVASSDSDEQIRTAAGEAIRAAESLGSSPPAEYGLSAQRLLVVDDYENSARVVVENLRRAGYSAEYETKPKEALRRFRESDFDLVVSDYLMGEMDGIELARALKDTNRGVPVILMSGYGPQPIAEEGLYVEFLTKPLEFPKFLEVVSRYIGVPQKKRRYA